MAALQKSEDQQVEDLLSMADELGAALVRLQRAAEAINLMRREEQGYAS